MNDRHWRHGLAAILSMLAACSALEPGSTSEERSDPAASKRRSALSAQASAPLVAPHALRLFFNTTSSGADLADDAADVPILIRLGGSDFPFHEAQPDAEDLRFQAADGSLLAHEIELWDRDAQRAAVWVLVPRIRGRSTQEFIWMRWGDSRVPDASDGTSVFARYAWALHLGDANRSSLVTDARGEHDGRLVRHGHPANTADFSVQGVIGRALALRERSAVRMFDALSPRGSRWTLSLWAKHDRTRVTAPESLVGGLGGTGEVSIAADGRLFWAVRSGRHLLVGRTREAIAQLEDWHQYVLVLDARNIRVFVDGRELETDAKVLPSPAPRREGVLGASSRVHGFWQGQLDEVRLVEEALSSARVRFGYEIERPASALVGFGRVPIADRDRDRVPDDVERALGHDPDQVAPSVAVPSAWLNDPSVDQSLIYETPYGTQVPVQVPLGALSSVWNPVIELAPSLPGALPPLVGDERYAGLFRIAGELASSQRVQIPLFLPRAQPWSDARLCSGCFRVHYRPSRDAAWEPMQVADVTPEAVLVEPETLAGEYVIAFASERLLFVDDDVAGGDGTSWTRAYGNLQDALERARTLLTGTPSDVGVMIWVAEGTYKPGPPGAGASHFDLPGRVKLFGGFRGDGTGVRDPALHPTILSGDLNANGRTDPDDAEHVLWHVRPNEGQMWVLTTLDGFLVEHGYAGDALTPNGGGMFVGGYAGGLRLLLSNMVFRDNYAERGGAVYVDHNSPYGELYVLDSTFRDNRGELAGGAAALVAHNAAVLTIVDGNQFLGNRTAFAPGTELEGGGALFIDNYSVFPDSAYVQVSRNVFAHNWSDSTGGALRTRGSPTDLWSCVFYDNWARTRVPGSEGGGGAIHSTDGLLRIARSTFADNYASLVDPLTADVLLVDDGAFRVADSIFYSPLTVYNPPWPRLIRRVSGDVSIDHSYVEGGVANAIGGVNDGGSNLGEDPESVPPGFADFLDPDGPDDRFATADDGLRLSDVNSACFAAGSRTAIDTDVLWQKGASDRVVDLGAYWVALSPYAGVDFLESATQSFGFDRVEPGQVGQPDPEQIYISSAAAEGTTVDVVVEDGSRGLYASSSAPEHLTLEGAVGNRLPLTRNVQTLRLVTAPLVERHAQAQLEVRDSAGAVVRALNVEVYQPFEIPTLMYYRVFDSTSPRAGATTPTLNPSFEALRGGTNRYLRQAVVTIESVEGSATVDLPYDANGNGVLDWYPGDPASDVELPVLEGAGLAGDAKLALVGGARVAYRLAAPLTAGATEAQLASLEGISYGYYMLGPESSDGDPNTADGDERVWVNLFTIVDGVPTVQIRDTPPTLDHGPDEVLFANLGGLSSDPQVIASTPGLFQAVAHELLHRADHPSLGNLLHVYAGDNLMNRTLSEDTVHLRFRRQELVSDFYNEGENQWNKTQRIGYSLLRMAFTPGGRVTPASAVFEDGEPITVSASAAPGYGFAGWQVLSGSIAFQDPDGEMKATTNIVLLGGDAVLLGTFTLQ